MAQLDPGYGLNIGFGRNIVTVQRPTLAELLAEVELIQEASNGGNIFAAYVVEALFPPPAVIPEKAAANVIKAEFGATEAPAEAAPAAEDKGCPNKPQCGKPLSEHRFVPAGVSKRTGKPYNSFSACPD